MGRRELGVLQAQQMIHLAKTRFAKIRLTRHLVNAPLIAAGTLIAVGTFRPRNNP